MIFIIDNELFALAVINLLKILLRTWSYFRILLKSSSYDPERVIDGLFFHARNVKKIKSSSGSMPQTESQIERLKNIQCD